MGKSGFEFSGSGRLDRIDTFTTKNGKDIITLVLQVEGAYPQLVPIKAFGRLAEMAASLTVGDVIEVTGHLGGRDYNGRVYGDIVAESIDVVSSGAKQSSGKPAQHRDERAPDPHPEDSDDVPF
jgi:single-stranded DNA-binding protein